LYLTAALCEDCDGRMALWELGNTDLENGVRENLAKLDVPTGRIFRGGRGKQLYHDVVTGQYVTEDTGKKLRVTEGGQFYVREDGK